MSAADRTDAELGARALDGDRDAFTELFSRHEGGLYNVVHRMTGSREDAADITQEAFLRVFARLGDLEGREVNLATYLHRTARNLVYDRSSRGARETPVSEIADAAGADPALGADPTDPREPPEPEEPPPGTTTRDTPPDIPFPTTFTVTPPPVVIG